MMRTDSHWEPPDGRKLLLTVHAFAELIEVSLSKAYSLAHVLERVYYAPGQAHFRLTVSSVDAFRELLAQGLSIEEARDVMAGHRFQGSPPVAAATRRAYQAPRSSYFRRRRRW